MGGMYGRILQYARTYHGLTPDHTHDFGINIIQDLTESDKDFNCSFANILSFDGDVIAYNQIVVGIQAEPNVSVTIVKVIDQLKHLTCLALRYPRQRRDSHRNIIIIVTGNKANW